MNDMHILPFHKETLVLSFEDIELLGILERHILHVDQKKDIPPPDRLKYPFVGRFSERRFSISRNLKSPENFAPLVKGKIEPTSTGTIVFLTYHLFFSSNMFLIFWSVITFLMALLFAFHYERYWLAVVAIGMGIANYVIAVLNFQIHLRKTQQAMYGMLQE